MSLPEPSKDGVDHINVYSKGKTELGRQLSNFYKSVFVLPDDGMFKSVEGYWFWLGTGKQHESLRYSSGYTAKANGSKYAKVVVEAFEEKIKSAIAAKIHQNPELEELLKQSTLPLEHYYYYGSEESNKVIPLPKYRWMVDWIEKIRADLQAA